MLITTMNYFSKHSWGNVGSNKAIKVLIYSLVLFSSEWGQVTLINYV